MVLAKTLTYGEPRHITGDQYVIPVTLVLKDGETEVFSFTLGVNHNSENTIAESMAADEVKHNLQKAIDSYFKKESVKAKTDEITTALGTLKDKLEIPK